LAFSPDGRTIAVGLTWGGTIWLVDATTGKELRRLSAPEQMTDVDCLAFSPDSGFIAASSKMARWDAGVWEVRSGILVRELRSDPLAPSGLVRGADGTLKRAGTTRGAIHLAFSRDGLTLLTCNRDSTFRLWELSTGGRRIEFDDIPFSDATFLPIGLLVTADAGHVRVWDWRVPRDKSPNVLTEKDLKILWDKLGASDVATAHEAAAILRACAVDSVGFISKNTKPVPVVAQAVVTQWSRELGSEDYQTREEAMKRLRDLSESARPTLEAARAKTDSPEVLARIDELIRATRKVPTMARVRVVRALEVLELIGSGDSVAVVKEIARGMPGAWETETAKAAVSRMAGQKK
jgi:WD40 repeat protein